ncbi:MAG: NAD(P)-dependent dehydrogenase (short-subunit alcohol dehydrogenase family) [Candidatus Aldehydirespiratoraceae bacterium]|jgi:NAD(P)-dependent dehydrogenase (short-subunit alcohol dehydrogenase family)
MRAGRAFGPLGLEPREFVGSVAMTDNSTSVALDPLSLFGLNGQVAIVTGASSGLGARFARVLHAVGATVVLAARRVDRLEELAAELPGSLVVGADLSIAEDRERLVATTLEQFGRVDVLVNNAGVGTATRIEDETLEQFRFAMEVNVTAIWHLSKLCGESMVAAGSGSIINVASMLGHVASAPIKQAHYCASKGAVINMTRELAAQWGRKGVRVNALSPGWFKSEMTGEMDTDDSSQAFVKANAMLPRMGSDDELDGALLLLASRAGGYMTGHSLLVDGGWTAR